MENLIPIRLHCEVHTVKKLCSILISILFVFSLCACSNDVEQSSNSDVLKFDFVENIDSSLKETCERLSIKESDIQESKHRGRYDFVSKETYKNIDFTKYLMFEEQEKENILYGGGYESKISKNDESLSVLIESMKQMISDEFGSPTTYPGVKNSIGEIKDFSVFSNESLVEEWQDGTKGKITLRLTFNEEDVLIQLDYKKMVAR